jgi:hypothetical protein
MCNYDHVQIKILVESLPQTPSLKTIVLFNALSEADLKELSKVEGSEFLFCFFFVLFWFCVSLNGGF